MKWAMLCKRTEDPKLSWIEDQLKRRGIPSRRNGESAHGPILEVQTKDFDKAWAFLGERWKRTRYTVDDIRDDHPDFFDFTPYDDGGEYQDEMAELRKAALSNGRP